ncbi:hypothetical protein [Streptomyces tsukubensis]|uniref:hypothetical protein n=1 Tax=Streptomyces tsukubensis TaxID=83656 RepID=UPI00344E2F07
MSAREKILDFVRANESSREVAYDPATGHAVDDSGAHVSSLLDTLVRELAKEVREGCVCAPGCCSCDAAADRISQEVRADD